MSQHLLFDAAGMYLAAPANCIKGVHEAFPVQTVSNTRSWFLGLGVAGGRLLPVTDIGAFSGKSVCTGRTIELEPSVGIAGLRVDQVFGFSEVPPESTTSQLPADTETGESVDADALALTGQHILDRQRMFYVLDIPTLLQSAKFLDIRQEAEA